MRRAISNATFSLQSSPVPGLANFSITMRPVLELRSQIFSLLPIVSSACG
jgi:hypothetical protein